MMQWLPSLVSGFQSDIKKITAEAEAGMLICKNKMPEPTGDIRYWGPDENVYPLVSKFIEMAIEASKQAGYEGHVQVVPMINYISVKTSPTGSGGGWHVDSVRQQNKLFCYLTDCLSINSGPLCILTHRSRFLERLVILLNRAFGGGRRFSDDKIKWLKKIGFREAPILAEAGAPFYACTSRIHRGLPILEGRRIMMTAYIFEDHIPQHIRELVSDDRKTV